MKSCSLVWNFFWRCYKQIYKFKLQELLYILRLDWVPSSSDI
jgi:hypothetical protein